jgi:PDZ-binding kinase
VNFELFFLGVSVYRLKRSPKVGIHQSPWAVKRVVCTNVDSTYSERLKNEANILKKLNHPNIVGFRAFVKAEDGRDCLAMEECDTSVADLIEERSREGLGPFPAEKILKFALDIGKALDYLHRVCHLLHGDIKSFNILVKGVYMHVNLSVSVMNIVHMQLFIILQCCMLHLIIFAHNAV